MVSLSRFRVIAAAAIGLACMVLPARTAEAAPPVGSCEFDGGAACATLSEPLCNAFGGLWLGEGTTCALPLGACRVGSLCDRVPEAFCTDYLGGTYDGDGTFCEDTGACCLPSVVCVDEIEEDECIVLGGTFLGLGTACPDLSREDLELCSRSGACCLGDGTCATYDQPALCEAAGGLWLGTGSSCDDADCLGACCLPDESCGGELSRDACLALGGHFQGAGTDCAGACPVLAFESSFDRRTSGATVFDFPLPAFDAAAGLRRLDGARVTLVLSQRITPFFTNTGENALSPVFNGNYQLEVLAPQFGDDPFELIDCQFSATCCDGSGCLAPGDHCDFDGPIACTGTVVLETADPAVIAALAAGELPELQVTWNFSASISGGGGFSVDTGRQFIEGRVKVGYAYTALGACCLCDGTCELVTEDECLNLGGTYAGTGVDCAAAACAPVGSCCLCDGTCDEEVTEAECLAAGGSWNGACSTCADADCPVIGACCFCDGSCTFGTEAECAAAGGTFAGACTSCEDAGCVAVGACCFCDGTCADGLSEAECIAAAGTWQGPCTACDEVACPVLGACCFCDGTCTDTTEADCAAEGGTFQGACTSCEGSTCEPIGACCLCDGTCTDGLTADECAANGGDWLGACSDCADAECPVLGACCFCDGTCTDTTEADCAVRGGSFAGPCTDCLTANCTEQGACCLCDGDCMIVSPTACELMGGVYAGACTTCEDQACTPFGTCCLCDGTCIDDVTEAECWENPLAVSFEACGDCAGGACEVVGTCCLCTGECLGSVTAEECAAAGGEFLGGCATCEDAACAPVGVCCLCDGTCVITTEFGCTVQGGDFTPSTDPENCITCADADCAPRGACCLCDGVCVPGLTEAECDAEGGRWAGRCSGCTEGEAGIRAVAGCEDFGACCLCSGEVVDGMTRAGCADFGGEYLGPCSDSDSGVACTPRGLCCLEFIGAVDSLCLDGLTLAECQAEAQALGAFPVFEILECATCPILCHANTNSCFRIDIQGFSCEDFGFRTYSGCTDCSDAGGPLGACCIPDAPCVQAPEIVCIAAGGTWLGMAVSCETASCDAWTRGGIDETDDPLLLVLLHLGPCEAGVGPCPGDLDGDRRVGPLDLVIAARLQHERTGAARRRASAVD